MANEHQLVVTINNISWKHLLMTSKDFVTLVEILGRSRVADDVYTKLADDSIQKYYVLDKSAEVRAETIDAPVISRSRHDEIKASVEAQPAEIVEVEV